MTITPAILLASQEKLRQIQELHDELKALGVLRTDNQPTGDYAESWASVHLNLTLEKASAKSHDAIDADGRRVQIKSSRKFGQSSIISSAIHHLHEDPFDYVIVILMNKYYVVKEVLRIPRNVILDVACRSPNKSYYYFVIDSNFRNREGVNSVPVMGS